MSSAFRGFLSFVIAIGTILASIWFFSQSKSQKFWTAKEVKVLQSLWIGSLPPVPTDTSNAVADHPQAAQLGYQLFFDTRLSANGQISCATCHQPERFFTDGLTVAEGAKTGIRNTMSIIGTAYSPWLFWDGRKDSLWSQALSPLENSKEHAGSRMQYAHLITQDENYRSTYELLFGPLPNLLDKSRFPAITGHDNKMEWSNVWHSMLPEDRDAVTKIFVNLAKSIAAYERLLLPGPSRFDLYVKCVIEDDQKKMDALTRDEVAGLRLFIGKAQCINCHNGPLFTNNEFHNTGVLSSPGELPSMGRVSGVRVARADPFNCLGLFNDAANQECAELRFTRTGDELIGTHKVPSLRNVAETGPYMHSGQLNNLVQVIEQYNRAPTAMIGHNEAKPLGLSIKERRQLEAFLHALSGPLATDSKWLARP